jgi:hypothetical protein
MIAQVQGRGKLLGQQRWIAYQSQVDEADARWRDAPHLVRRPDGEARLAHATRSHKRHQPRPRQQLPHPRDLGAPADEAGALGREAACRHGHLPGYGCSHRP